jgi:P27 family predicted phage terminase small subunit
VAKRGRKPAPRVVAAIVEADGWAPPAHLGDGARAEFTRLVDVLRRLGTLDKTDVRVVEAYATTAALLADATRETAAGAFVIDRFGQTQAHPALAVINSATMRLKALAHELGLTPASSRHAGTTAGDGNPWADLLSITG